MLKNCNQTVTIIFIADTTKGEKMDRPRESSETVKDRIIKVATELFAKYGVNGVGIRRIASDAGINHALIIRYFGSKEALVTEILYRKISAIANAYPRQPEQPSVKALSGIRKIILDALENDENTMKLIVRAELDGLSPESFVNGNSERGANQIAKWIGSKQTDKNLPEPKLVSLIITGAIFSLASISPWLMTAVGMSPEDYQEKKEEIIDAAVWMIAQAIGMTKIRT